MIQPGLRRRRRHTHSALERVPAADDERERRQAFRVSLGRNEGPTEAAAVLSVDPPSDVGAERLVHRVETGREHARVTEVDLKVAETGTSDECHRQTDDLDVGGKVALSQQLCPDLEHLSGTAPALRLLSEHVA